MVRKIFSPYGIAVIQLQNVTQRAILPILIQFVPYQLPLIPVFSRRRCYNQ